MNLTSQLVRNVISKMRTRGIGDLGERVTIGKHVILKNKGKISIGSGTWIDDFAYLNGASRGGLRIGSNCQIRYSAYIDGWKGEGISIGNDTFIGPFTIIQGQGGVDIASDCLIGGHCYIVPSNHVFADPELAIRKQGETQLGISIEEDVCIGGNTIILDGVRVGRGSVIGAGSIVTRTVPPNSVAYGCPARVVRKRSGAGEE